MDVLTAIEQNLRPERFDLPDHVWNSLIINSRIRYDSFFRQVSANVDRKDFVLEGTVSASTLKEYIGIVLKWFRLKTMFAGRKAALKVSLSDQDIFILKTFCYKQSLKDKFVDPIFMELTDHLGEKKEHLILVDPILEKQDYQSLYDRTGNHVLPWYSFIESTDFVKALLLQLWYFVTFRKKDDHWTLEIHRELLQPTTFHHLLFYFAFRRIAKGFSASRFMMTFENNSWEKVVIQAYREVSPTTKILGYQHSVVPESTLGMRYLDWEVKRNCLPDSILTSGLETVKILNEFNPDLKERITPFCALRYDYLYGMTPKTDPLNKRILVALEGTPDVKDFVETIWQARNYFIDHNYEVTFRFHPILSYEQLRKMNLCEDLETFARISRAPLIEDLTKHDCTFYWGSTVSLESSYLGNALINFRNGFSLSHDPLFRSTELKATFSSAGEIPGALDQIYGLSESDLSVRRARAKTYIENYFTRPTKNYIQELLGSAP